jgi:hypothetical protein
MEYPQVCRPWQGAVSGLWADMDGEGCCGLGSRVGTRPIPTKMPEMKGNSVGGLVGARTQPSRMTQNKKEKMP